MTSSIREKNGVMATVSFKLDSRFSTIEESMLSTQVGGGDDYLFNVQDGIFSFSICSSVSCDNCISKWIIGLIRCKEACQRFHQDFCCSADDFIGPTGMLSTGVASNLKLTNNTTWIY